MYLTNAKELDNSNINPKKRIMVALNIKFNQPIDTTDLYKFEIRSLKIKFKSKSGKTVPAIIHCDKLERARVSETDKTIVKITYIAHIESDELNNTNIQKIRKLKQIVITNGTGKQIVSLTDFDIGTSPKKIKVKYLLSQSTSDVPGISVFSYSEKHFVVKTMILHNTEESDTQNTQRHHLEYTALPEVYNKAKIKYVPESE